ncbi:hypothetical protein Adt_09231 [Abeliophyllum distichum]|uniref:Uncharacterized protein n=1 Tax=Abeliophyllum distichum TaxID=126358 RepID=A0ABD1UGP4_9LAMI
MKFSFDAIAKAWSISELEEVEIDRVNRSAGKKKLTPKRSTTSASNQARERESTLQFMPTPGANMQHGDLNVLSGPSASRHVAEGMSRGIKEAAVIITEEVDISTMVDELEQLESQEASRNRADRARARTLRNNNALQSAYLTRSRGNV